MQNKQSFRPSVHDQKYAQVSQADTVYDPLQNVTLEDQPHRSEKDLWLKFNRSPIEILDHEKAPHLESNQPHSWKPCGLKAPILLSVVAIYAAVIAVLQVLLSLNKNNGGILFASRLSQLPAGDSFTYLLLPTIIASLFSILWSCIDLDAKRSEPWYQLSKSAGSQGKDSLLLQYPFEFLAVAPIQSARRKHWVVFTVSAATVMIFWGITPLQAGIFGTETITRSSALSMDVSTSFLPINQQISTLTLNYTFSAYGIVWLNESMPPYMTRGGVLAPFRPVSLTNFTGTNETWSARTQMYSLDLDCEEAGGNSTFWTSTNGCNVSRLGLAGPQGNDTIGTTVNVAGNLYRKYSALYAGYDDSSGFADYYISPFCPKTASDTFISVVVKNKEKESDPPNAPTAVFCRPTYFYQDVDATVSVNGLHVKEISNPGPKQPLPKTMFNTSLFEWSMNSAAAMNGGQGNRGESPAFSWPNSRGPMSRLNFTLDLSEASETMVGYALGAFPQENIDSYLDVNVWGQAWGKAYQLLFARAMSDALNSQVAFETSDRVEGNLQYQTQAVIVVPAFAYIVQALLGLLIVLALVVLLLASRRKCMLRSDPATLGAVMGVTADSKPLIETFVDLKGATEKEIISNLREKRFALTSQDGHIHLEQLYEERRIKTPTFPRELLLQKHAGLNFSIMQPHQITPMEYRAWYTIAFLFANGALLATLVILKRLAEPHGLPLPSQSRIVRQFVENFIPTILATLLEPIWLVLNRVICVMQPFEALRSGQTSAKRTLNLQYTSLPPQLSIFKAIGNKHFMLAIVCTMALLANVLAVASSRLLSEDLLTLSKKINFGVSYLPEIVNGSVQTYWNLSESANGLPTFVNPSVQFPEEAFYVVMSNITSSTALPPWTDTDYFYVPFDLSSMFPTNRNGGGATINANSTFQAARKAYGSHLECFPLTPDTANNHTVQLKNGNEQVTCHTDINLFGSTVYPNCSGPPLHMEMLSGLNLTDPAPSFCQEHLIAGWVRTPGGGKCTANASVVEQDMTLIACRVILSVADANVTVDTTGRVQHSTVSYATAANSSSDAGVESLQPFFGATPTNFAHQMISLFLSGKRNITGGPGGDDAKLSDLYFESGWANDSFPSDFANYFAMQLAGNNSLLDPSQAAPQWTTAAGLLSDVFSRVFAVTMSRNLDTLLQSTASSSSLAGQLLTTEPRIVVSNAMFIIAASILSLSMLVSATLFLRRPARFLPRLPTTLASTLALVAGSHAQADLRNTGHLSGRQRKQRVQAMGHVYGFGAHVGTDGKVRVGVERRPYLQQQQQQQQQQQRPSRLSTRRSGRDGRRIGVRRGAVPTATTTSPVAHYSPLDPAATTARGSAATSLAASAATVPGASRNFQGNPRRGFRTAFGWRDRGVREIIPAD